MRGIACAIAALLLLHSALAVRFTEIMYDPPGSDNNREFLEVGGAWNLSGWIVADASSNDTLVPLQLNESSEYALIVEEGFWFGNLSCNIYSAGSTIGNNLNNDGDALALFDENGTRVAATNYTGDVASNNGRSLELRNGSWTASASLGGSPCASNPDIEGAGDGAGNGGNATGGNDTPNGWNGTENTTTSISLAVLLPATTYLGITYTRLFRIQNEAYISGTSTPVNVTVAYDVTRDNETILEGNFTKTINKYSSARTGHLLLDGQGNYTLCGRIISVDGEEQEEGTETCAAFSAVDPATIPCNVTLRLQLFDGKRVYDTGEQVKFRHIVTEESADGTAFPYVIQYAVEDILTGKTTVKITENTNQKTFTPHINGIGAFLIKSVLTAVTCNNTAAATEDARLVVVRGESAKKNASRVEIKDVTPSAGGAKVTLSLYRGDTRKYSVKVWLEDARGRKASNVVSLSLLQDFQEYDSAVTLPLKYGAKGGRYTAVVEGLGERDSVRVTLDGNVWAVTNDSEAETPRIASFYTRSRKAAATIILYSMLKGTGEVVAELTGLIDHSHQAITLNGSFVYKHVVNMTRGPNVFILTLKDGANTTLDRQVLLLEMDENITAVPWFTIHEGRTEEREKSGAEQRILGNKTLGNNETSDEGGMTPTGMAVFAEENGTSVVPALFGLIGLLLLGLVLQHRR